MNLKNPDLDLIRRVWILWIHDPFLDLPKKKAKFIFGFGNPDLDFPKKKRTLKVNLLLTSYLRVLWRKCLCFCSLCFFTDAHFHIGIAASISHFLTAAT